MPSLSPSIIADKTQNFYKEAVTWKYLNHRNILPLLGVTTEPLQLISNWVSGGNLLGYVQTHPRADRLRLVGGSSVVIVRRVILLSVMRSCRGPPLPPLPRSNTRGPQRSTWLFRISFPTVDTRPGQHPRGRTWPRTHRGLWPCQNH